MITFTDDEIDLFAQTLHAGYFADMGESSVLWENASGVQRGNWRRAARALIRHLYHGQPVNNWRHVVQKHTGEHYHTAQASLVRAAAESLLQAWQGWDQRERRAA